MNSHLLRVLSFGLVVCGLSLLIVPSRGAEVYRTPPKNIRDILWVWSTPDREKPDQKEFGPGQWVEAPSPEKMKMLNVPNVLMAGAGLPDDFSAATRLSESVSEAPHVVWEVLPDGEIEYEGDDFVYEKRLSDIRRLAARYPNQTGIMLDDLSSVALRKGFDPEKLKELRRGLGEYADRIKLWSVIYTKDFDKPEVDKLLEYSDVINLWEWYPNRTMNLEENVATIEQKQPGKPIVLGLYMYDYSPTSPRPIRPDLMREQCETALRLAHEGRIQGIVFLSIDNDSETIQSVKQWIDEVGDQTIGQPVAENVFRTDGSLQGCQLRFHTDHAYRDFEANFTVSMPSNHADVGMIVRAQDPRHYYLVHFPQSGQSFRAQHFWGAISKADGSGYLRMLKLQHIPRVASNPLGLTHRVNVKVEGNRIQVRINDYPAMEVVDDTYQEGYLGLSGFNKHEHGSLEIIGEPVAAPPFDTSNVQPRNWFHPFGAEGKWDVVPKAALTPKGNLVCIFNTGDSYQFARSEDKGRTWTIQDPPEAIETDRFTDAYGSLYTDIQCFDDGTMVAIHVGAREGEETAGGFRAVSEDDGITWTATEVKSDGPWKRETKTLHTGWMFKLQDQSLIRFGLGGHPSAINPVTKWGAGKCQGFATKSTDRGVTWSAPTNLDTDAEDMGNMDLTEPIGFERRDGKLVAFIRPIYSPWMWETWSNDAGESWGPCVRGPFPGYAPSVPVRTESGVVMFPVRFPGLTVHTTADDGMTWDGGGGGTYIDTSIWAMGSMVEVEPNVVLCLYMDSFYEKTRGQYIRVHPDGTLEPAREMLP